MNKRFKQAVQAAFEAPPPKNKEQFLKILRFPKTTYRNFLLNQLCYIRKRVWAVSVLIIIVGWMIIFQAKHFILWNNDAWKVWSISALLPFLATMTVSEIFRSTAYRMAELEAGCRYGLAQTIMARITILGGGNFSVLILLFIFLNRLSAFSLLQVTAYLMVPYLIVCGISLWLMNRIPGQEGIYACATVAGLVCITGMLTAGNAPDLYASKNLNLWLVLLAFSGMLMGRQLYKLLKRMEEQTWNLLSTE